MKQVEILLLLFLLSAPLEAAAGDQPASSSPESSQVIQLLNQTIDWYRQVAPLQQTATEPDDLLIMNDNGRMADQIVRLAFDFGRADADLISKQNKSQPAQSQDPRNSQNSAFFQLQAKIEKQVHDTQAELDTLKQKLAGATGAKRQTLQAQIDEIQGELDLTKARSDAMKNMAQFMGGAGNGATATGLRAQVDALAEAIPAAAASSAVAESETAAKPPLSAALAVASRPASSGIWELTADLYALSQKIHRVDLAIQETNALAKKSQQLRAPLISRIRELSSRGDQLASAADNAGPAELAQEKQQFDALAAQFRQVSAAAIPLSKQTILLDLYQKGLANWESDLRARRADGLKGLVVRLTFLAIVIGIVIAAAELWRKAVYRYIHDPRRRHQFLLLRKFVLWFLITVIIAFSFASRLGSVVTFAGLITAAVAVALQSVILAVVGYFFLIGKYGIRAGDRIQISGVTGEVVDVGLVRLHMMELGGGDFTPTGRVVAFSNSVVFQPLAGIFKQIPGTNFLWHEITLKLAPETDYTSVKKRLLGVVESVLADYRDDLERQYHALQSNLFSISTVGLKPNALLRFTPSAVEVVIRFPVDRAQGPEIDERVTRELINNLDHEPRLKLVASDSPSIVVRTDLAAA